MNKKKSWSTNLIATCATAEQAQDWIVKDGIFTKNGRYFCCSIHVNCEACHRVCEEYSADDVGVMSVNYNIYDSGVHSVMGFIKF